MGGERRLCGYIVRGGDGKRTAVMGYAWPDNLIRGDSCERGREVGRVTTRFLVRVLHDQFGVILGEARWHAVAVEHRPRATRLATGSGMLFAIVVDDYA